MKDEMLSSPCPLGNSCRSTTMERAEAVKLLNGLKQNTCWCEVGIDNPNYQGKHTAACLAVQEFMKAHA